MTSPDQGVLGAHSLSSEKTLDGPMESFDFVIVGSGSAGSTLAYRLSENGRHTVLVLEYGGSDWGPLIQMPSALSYPMNMKTYDWGFVSKPEPAPGDRRLATPR